MVCTKRCCAPSGDGVVRRHNALRTWLAKKLRIHIHAAVVEEEHVPRFDRTPAPTPRHPNPATQKARLDIVAQTDYEIHLYDVVVANLATTDVAEMGRRAVEPGRAARLAALRKRNRYDAEVHPFVVEDTGRLHPQTARTLHYLAAQTPDPTTEFQLLTAELQTILHSATYTMQRTAHGLRPY